MNAFNYSNICEVNWKENLADMGCFKPKYTFYGNFSIAEFCEVYMRDENAVKKTFNNVIRYWSGDYKCLTEIILVLNHKSWSFAQNVDSHYLNCGDDWRKHYTKLYTELYYKAVEMFFKLYNKDEDAKRYYYTKKYYYEITD